MGLGLVYSGMKLKPGEEILTDTRDHIVTALSADHAAERTGAKVRQAQLYADPSKVSVDEVVGNVRRNLRDNTRLLAVTWVHSGTGVKMPIAAIAEAVRAHNRGKPRDRQTLLSVDGVHGLGIENVSIPELGADFFIAGHPQMADRPARHRAGLGQARRLADGPGDDPDLRPDVALRDRSSKCRWRR